jgi:hypothetical protein
MKNQIRPFLPKPKGYLSPNYLDYQGKNYCLANAGYESRVALQ